MKVTLRIDAWYVPWRGKHKIVSRATKEIEFKEIPPKGTIIELQDDAFELFESTILFYNPVNNMYTYLLKSSDNWMKENADILKNHNWNVEILKDSK